MEVRFPELTPAKMALLVEVLGRNTCLRCLDVSGRLRNASAEVGAPATQLRCVIFDGGRVRGSDSFCPESVPSAVRV